MGAQALHHNPGQPGAQAAEPFIGDGVPGFAQIIGGNLLLARAPDHHRNIAAPRNAQRLGVQTPCAVKGERCFDCSSPQRICKGLSILWEAPIGSAVEVVLIRETLGY